MRQRPTESIIERLVKAKGVLMSRDVDAFMIDSGHGEIIVGGVRVVGEFRIRCHWSRADLEGLPIAGPGGSA